MSAPGVPTLISNPRESYQVNIIACASITWFLGATFVALRFYTRGRLLHNLGAEDWFILVALVFSGATCAGMIEQATYGLGKHALDVHPAVMMVMARAGWYTILWYMLALLFTKVSILLLYIRILSYQHARYAVYAIMSVVVFANGVWTLATVVTACIPLQAFWNPAGTPGASCRPTSYWYANTGLHIGTDVLLYILPLPIIINLQVKTRQKVALVCAISVVRLWELVEENTRADFTFDNVSISYLTCIEINAAIACACCMTLKPLVSRVFPRLWGSSSGSARAKQQQKRQQQQQVAGAGAGGAVGGVAGRGPPTIGSSPSRMSQQQQQQQQMKNGNTTWAVLAHERNGSHSQLLEDDDDDYGEDSLGGVGADEKRDLTEVVMVVDIEAPMVSPLDATVTRMAMPREPPNTYRIAKESVEDKGA
ncbi:hypothetical protein B0H63DRAFT_435777 [Podospora didyma]|uniref:Rhodopsin domain-containing protein n=1 Tax=Podospora didyma TaxID=330526 RepID=A0AAE0NB76_9PEZI|nr:hypothetical protein B0H63DRAFT_435777 [Podospora didyma]